MGTPGLACVNPLALPHPKQAIMAYLSLPFSCPVLSRLKPFLHPLHFSNHFPFSRSRIFGIASLTSFPFLLYLLLLFQLSTFQ